MKNLLVTGGAGFVGCNFIRYILERYEDYRIIALDALTYAGHIENLEDLMDHPRFKFVQGDIRNADDVAKPMKWADVVVNFAAETHVDRSIAEPEAFITTDIMGVYVLMEAAKKYGVERFLQASTDEVYGEAKDRPSKEDDPISPNNPYSASKAGGELLARAYYRTYGVPVITTRSSNTFGPYQHPEKMFPFFVTNAIDNKPLPIYGEGDNVRDWMFVLDHVTGIETALIKGEPGQIYNLTGGNMYTNIEMAKMILAKLGKNLDLIEFVEDRPGHDKRYAFDASKLLAMGWNRSTKFEEQVDLTIQWYVDNQDWWRKIRSSSTYEVFRSKWYDKRSTKQPQQ